MATTSKVERLAKDRVALRERAAGWRAELPGLREKLARLERQLEDETARGAVTAGLEMDVAKARADHDTASRGLAGADRVLAEQTTELRNAAIAELLAEHDRLAALRDRLFAEMGADPEKRQEFRGAALDAMALGCALLPHVKDSAVGIRLRRSRSFDIRTALFGADHAAVAIDLSKPKQARREHPLAAVLAALAREEEAARFSRRTA